MYIQNINKGDSLMKKLAGTLLTASIVLAGCGLGIMTMIKEVLKYLMIQQVRVIKAVIIKIITHHNRIKVQVNHLQRVQKHNKKIPIPRLLC